MAINRKRSARKPATTKTLPIAKVAGLAKRGSRPGERRGGRKKGTPNKFSGSVKQAVLDTFEALGGVKHMTSWARKHPAEFYRIAARLLPREVTGEEGAPIRHGITVRFVKPGAE